MTSSLVFWSLYTFDRKLILPVSFDQYYSPLLVHLHYTLPFFVTLLDAVIDNHHYTSSSVIDLTSLVIVILIYMCALFAGKFLRGKWANEAFAHLSIVESVVFLFVVGVVGVGVYYLGKYINTTVWDKKKQTKTTKNKKE